MKTSFIATMLNEEKSIVPFLHSLLSQSKMPDEIILTDACSTDKTREYMNKTLSDIAYKHILKYTQVKIFSKKLNRAAGRNEAIKHARGEIIACSDIGCLLDKEWLSNITAPFTHRDVDAVAGYYLPVTKNIFEKCVAAYTCIMPDALDANNFLPSSRSIAFKKSVWKRVGGYPEYLDTCEDLVFAKKLKKYNCVFAENAIVRWPQKNNLYDAFLQLFRYAKGDGKARYFRFQTPFLLARYLFGLLLFLLFVFFDSRFVIIFLLALFFVYIGWAVKKNFRYVKHWQAFFLLPVLQLTADVAVLSGTSIGYISSFS